MALLQGDVLPASFRGAPFAVINSDVSGGRRVALHLYPGREDPWAEDMGRAARRWRFRGFIVDGDVVFAGGPILLQRAVLLAALEKAGPGILIHPTLGAVQASVAGFSIGEGLDASRTSSVDIEFVEAGKRQFPSILSSSQGLFSASNLVTLGLAADGVRAIALAASAGGRREDLASTSYVIGNQVVTLGNDATALNKLAAQLPGNFGRFAQGANAGLNGTRATPYSSQTQLSDLVKVAAQQRAGIAIAASDMQTTIAGSNLLYATDVADGVTTLVQRLANACPDPADAVRLLEQLIAFPASFAAAETNIGLAFCTMVRRAAVASLILAVGQYQPTSADDAAARITEVAPILSDAADTAAAAGDDQSFKALRAARAAIVSDLRTRGATLPQIKVFEPGRAFPALTLAQRYYRDATRADQIVTQVQPVHPLFMPPSYSALAA